MEFPKLTQLPAARETVDVFLGYQAGTRCAPGEFADMENLSSDGFPLMTVRRRRGLYARTGLCTGLLGRDSLCYVDGSRFVINGYEVEMGLSQHPDMRPKHLVSMGAYVVIFPDKKYINTADLTDFGSLEADVATTGTVTFTPAGADGEERIPDFIQSSEPEEAENMALWLEIGGDTPVLRQWSAAQKSWVEVAQTYVRIQAPGIGSAFGQYDGVTLSGLTGELEQLCGGNVIWERGEDWVLIPGLLPRQLQSTESLRITRLVPQMDHVIEAGNRLWGCRYGLNASGEPVNEIYASKLGDFKNWSCYMGLSTDSYAVSLGEDGPFTGAVNHLGYPVFFRENCLHKIFGSYPAAFRLQTTPCAGVQRGSSGSLAMVGAVLYYKSIHGVYAYDGSLPVPVSQALGTEYYENAAAGALGNKYYIAMRDRSGADVLFVYDTARQLWHREDGIGAAGFCTCRDQLYFLDREGCIRTATEPGETDASWMAQTGELIPRTPEAGYLRRLDLRLRIPKGARVKVLLRYDEAQRWEQAALLQHTGEAVFTLPLRVRRCSRLSLRLEGEGDVQLLAMTKILALGSDVF